MTRLQIAVALLSHRALVQPEDIEDAFDLAEHVLMEEARRWGETGSIKDVSSALTVLAEEDAFKEKQEQDEVPF